ARSPQGRPPADSSCDRRNHGREIDVPRPRRDRAARREQKPPPTSLGNGAARLSLYLARRTVEEARPLPEAAHHRTAAQRPALDQRRIALVVDRPADRLRRQVPGQPEIEVGPAEVDRIEPSLAR